MKAKYSIGLGSILCFFAALLLISCESPAPDKQGKKETPKKEQKGEVAKKEANGNLAKENIGEQANEVVLNQDEQRLNDFVANKSIEQQGNEVVITHLINSAKGKIARHEYKAAGSFLDEALKRDPANSEANSLRVEVGSYLGETRFRSEDLIQGYEKELNVKQEQAKLEARNYYKKGKGHFANKEYDKSIRSFESCLEIIKWAPFELNLSGMEKDVNDHIKKAQAGKERWLAKVRQEKMREAQLEAERLESEEQGRKQLRTRILLSRATEHYSARRYDKAEALINQILEEDPANKIARKLLQDVRDARHSTIADKTLARRIDAWKEFLQDAQETMIPYSQDLIYPDQKTWHEVIAKRDGANQLGKSGPKKTTSNAEKTILSRLESLPITLNFNETPFQDVIRFIQTTADINIVTDPKVIQNFEIEGTKVTLNVTDLKLKTALNILLEFHNLVFTFRDDVLFITDKESELAKGEAITVLHDIRDLTGQVKDFPGPKLKLEAPGENGSTGTVFDEGEGDGDPVLTGERLTELIRSSIAPDSWEAEDYSIAETSGQLLVINTDEVQEEIRNFLSDMRRFSGLMVAIEARFLTVTDEFLEDVGVEWRGIGENTLTGNGDRNRIIIPTVPQAVAGGGNNNDQDNIGQSNSPAAGFFFQENAGKNRSIDTRARTENIDNVNVVDFAENLTGQGGLAMQLAFLDDIQLNAVLEAVRQNARTEVMAAPRITTFNTQRAHLTVVNQRSYVQDFDVEVAQSAYIADPVIGAIQDGVVLDVRPTISNDQKYITLEMRPTIATLIGGQFTPLITTLGGLDQVTIEIPELELQSIETTVRVPDGGTLLLAGFKDLNSFDRKQDVPFLGDIPVIGFFFSRRTKLDFKKQTMILVKAKVINLGEEEEKAVGFSR